MSVDVLLNYRELCKCTSHVYAFSYVWVCSHVYGNVQMSKLCELCCIDESHGH